MRENKEFPLCLTFCVDKHTSVEDLILKTKILFNKR